MNWAPIIAGLAGAVRGNEMSGPGATPALVHQSRTFYGSRIPTCDLRADAGALKRLLRYPVYLPFACLLSTPPLIAIIALLAGCAIQPSAPPPIQIQTRTVEVKVPVPVPCFREDERPIMPTPTPINLQTATIDQMAAAIDADALADSIYTAAVDRLFLQCQKAGGTP